MDTGRMVKFSLSMLQKHTGRLEVHFYSTYFLTLTLGRGAWLTTRPSHFTPGKEP